LPRSISEVNPKVAIALGDPLENGFLTTIKASLSRNDAKCVL
jgi:hypothetical protein